MPRNRLTWQRLLLHTVLLSGSLIMAYPLIFGLLASFMDYNSYRATTTWLPIPTDPTLDNYRQIFSLATYIPRWIGNTLVRIVWYCIVPGFVAVWTGYAFARLRFRGRDTLFVIILASMMIPAIVYAIPTYIMLARWPLAGGNDIWGQGGTGFINRWGALLLPSLVNAYFIFLLRQTFWSIPRDFEEAARIDGANTWQVMRHVYLPMLTPAITVMVIFQSVAVWNDYLWPLIATAGNPEIWPLALGFQRAMQVGAQVRGLPPGTAQNYPFVFALATVALLPIVALFLWLQKYFVEGVQGFALKG